MISYVFRRALDILKSKPFMLWGVSLLCVVITFCVKLGAGLLPVISVPIVITLEAGMAALYLDGYNGKEVNSKQLFKGFTKECFPRVTAGMLWQYLWTIIWAFVPVMNYIKIYQYAFTPYILLTRPDVSPLDALKISMKETEGYKARMFGAGLLMSLILLAVIFVFSIIMIIPVIGWMVGFVGIVASIALFPLFSGLVMAGFYEEAQRGNFKQVYQPYGYNTPMQNAPVQNETVHNIPQNQDEASAGWFCAQCGAKNSHQALFCTRCGRAK